MTPEHNSRTPTKLRPAKQAFLERGIKYTSGRDICFRGEIPVVKIGRAWYLDERDLESWIERRKERLA